MIADDEPTNPGGHEPPEPPTARERLRDELAGWAPIPGAPAWQNDSDERQARRFSLLAEVISDRDAETERHLLQVEDAVEQIACRVADLEARVADLEHPHPPTDPAPAPTHHDG